MQHGEEGDQKFDFPKDTAIAANLKWSRNVPIHKQSCEGGRETLKKNGSKWIQINKKDNMWREGVKFAGLKI